MEQDTDTLYRAYTTRDARFDGRVFAGVRTTGIYCRPVCPARSPRRENMTFFPTAAAAQAAGYRPCLRCRPESAPDLAGWRGASPVVARALSLIETGWLEDHDADALAAEVRISGRQLRRLFREQLGATPVAVAQTRRVLLAQQLIRDTDLSMADVALASGFGSVRRFNETFHALFNRPPATLRRQRAAGRVAPGITIRLAHREPYDWPGLLARLRAIAIPGVERVEGDAWFRALAVGERTGWLVVRPAPGGRAGLDLTVNVPELTALPRIVARVRRRLDLSADPAVIDAQLGVDPRLAPSLAAHPGLRLPGPWDGFEEAVRALPGFDVAALGGLAARFGSALGGEAAAASGLSVAFPAPADLVDIATIPDILGGSADDRITGALASLAVLTGEHPTMLDPYRDPQLVARRLAQLPGIDGELAGTIASRALEPHDWIPPEHRALVGALIAPGPPASLDRLHELTAVWSPWRGYAAAHLAAVRDRAP